jgi:hypothetical protein
MRPNFLALVEAINKPSSLVLLIAEVRSAHCLAKTTEAGRNDALASPRYFNPILLAICIFKPWNEAFASLSTSSGDHDGRYMGNWRGLTRLVTESVLS